MIIDFHTHNFPDALAPRAVSAMCEKLQGRLVPVGDGTVKTQLRDMDAAGVDCAVVCPIATRPTQYEVILKRSLAVMAGAEGDAAKARFHYLASLHPADRAFAEHARELAAAGIRGVALHPYYQNFRLDDPRIVPFFAAIRDAGLFAMAHCGGDSGYPDAPMACGPLEIKALLTRVPNLTFVACHLGGINKNPPHCVDCLLPFTNCYIDTAIINTDDAWDETTSVLSTWPAQRMLFGTDYFWRDEGRILARLKAARPHAKDLEMICWQNAKRLLEK